MNHVCMFCCHEWWFMGIGYLYTGCIGMYYIMASSQHPLSEPSFSNQYEAM